MFIYIYIICFYFTIKILKLNLVLFLVKSQNKSGLSNFLHNNYIFNNTLHNNRHRQTLQFLLEILLIGDGCQIISSTAHALAL